MCNKHRDFTILLQHIITRAKLEIEQLNLTYYFLVILQLNFHDSKQKEHNQIF